MKEFSTLPGTEGPVMPKPVKLEKLKEKEQKKGITRRGFMLGGLFAGVAAILSKNIASAERFLERSSNTSRRESEPRIHFKIFYAPHRTKEDLANFPEMLKESDIFVPEVFGWSEEYLKALREISNGLMVPKEFLDEMGNEPSTDPIFHFRKALLDSLYNSKKHVFIADIPENHPLIERHLNLMQLRFLEPEGGFPAMLENFKKWHSEFSQIQFEREKYMLDNLKALSESLREGKSDFQSPASKKDVSVLLNLGSIHTDISHKMSRGGADVSRSFNRKPFIYSFSNELWRRHIFGKKVDDELAAKSLLDVFFVASAGKKIYSIASDTEDVERFRRLVISNFNFKEIEGIFSGVKKREEIEERLNKKLEEKNIAIPSTKEELEKIVSDNKYGVPQKERSAV